MISHTHKKTCCVWSFPLLYTLLNLDLTMFALIPVQVYVSEKQWRQNSELWYDTFTKSTMTDWRYLTKQRSGPFTDNGTLVVCVSFRVKGTLEILIFSLPEWTRNILGIKFLNDKTNRLQGGINGGGREVSCLVRQASAWKNDINSIPFSRDTDILCPWECGTDGHRAHIFLGEMPSALGRLAPSRSGFGWRKEADEVSLRAARCSIKARPRDGLKSEFRSFLPVKKKKKKKKQSRLASLERMWIIPPQTLMFVHTGKEAH